MVPSKGTQSRDRHDEKLEARVPGKPPPSVPRLLATLSNGFRGRCPRCGKGRILTGFYNVLPHCSECGLDFHESLDGTWAFMYMSTAFLTGVILLVMLLIPPPETALGQLVLLPVALVLILGTLPRRKCVAMAIEFLLQARLGAGPDPDP